MKESDLTREDILNSFTYHKESGLFFNARDKNGNGGIKGMIAGYMHHKGYVYLCIKNIRLCAHRVAWFLEKGYWPSDFIDHLNGHRSDNRIENLREANNTQNMHNRKINHNNSSGVKGVCWLSKKQVWLVQVRFNKKTYSKTFKELEDAKDYADQLRKDLHKEFSRDF